MSNLKVYYNDSRNMAEIENESVACVITSPPYFNYKNYETVGEIEGTVGHISDSYTKYISDLTDVFAECLEKLIPNGKLCVNIPNMKSRKSIEGVSFLYPIIADVTKSCIELGYYFSDEIIWVKGKANAGALNGKPLFGSYPYPPNFKILDSIQESILIFRKKGNPRKFTKEVKEKSKLSKEQWIQYTQGVWHIPPEHQNKGHCAVFPIEIPKRLIQLYTFVGDTVLDPFLGSGTTLKACGELERNGIGYEISESYKEIINNKLKQEGADIESFLPRYKQCFSDTESGNFIKL